MIKDQYNSIEEYYLDAANKYVDYANDYFSEGALEPDLKRLKNFKDIDKFTVEFSLDTSSPYYANSNMTMKNMETLITSTLLKPLSRLSISPILIRE